MSVGPEAEEPEVQDLGEGPSTSASTARTTQDKPLLDERWELVDELPDDDEAYEPEETTYITLDFTPDVAQDVVDEMTAFQLTGVETEEPWACIGNRVLRGRHERVLGSDFILSNPSRTSERDAPRLLEPLGSTRSRIRFEQVKLVPKKTSTAVTKHNATSFLLPSGRGSRGGKSAAKPVSEHTKDEQPAVSVPKKRGRPAKPKEGKKAKDDMVEPADDVPVPQMPVGGDAAVQGGLANAILGEVDLPDIEEF